MHQAQEGGCSPRYNDTTGAVIVRVIIELSMPGKIGGTWDQWPAPVSNEMSYHDIS